MHIKSGNTTMQIITIVESADNKSIGKMDEDGTCNNNNVIK